MFTSEPNTVETRHGGPGSAQDTPTRASSESQSRRQEILRADPYYPHTGTRAIAMLLGYFFILLGFMALLDLLIPVANIKGANLLTPALIATASVGSQWLWRKARVGVLESSGQISSDLSLIHI